MSPDPRYTHGHAESVLRSHRWRTAENSAAHLLGRLRAGQRLLDVGAGPGTITADLARLVSPGPVTATEISEAALAHTAAGLAAAGVADVELRVADVHALDLPTGTFDVVHAHQVLQHVADPILALWELVRVCADGGVVAVRDSDYSGFVWAPADPALDRWRELYLRAARANGGEPDAGRHLAGWVHRAFPAGVSDGRRVRVSATTSTWCHADEESRAYWGGMWAERIVASDIAEQILSAGWATRGELEEISAAWQRWAATGGAMISILHGEVLLEVEASV